MAGVWLRRHHGETAPQSRSLHELLPIRFEFDLWNKEARPTFLKKRSKKLLSLLLQRPAEIAVLYFQERTACFGCVRLRTGWYHTTMISKVE
jgi:hypothetical protein